MPMHPKDFCGNWRDGAPICAHVSVITGVEASDHVHELAMKIVYGIAINLCRTKPKTFLGLTRINHLRFVANIDRFESHDGRALDPHEIAVIGARMRKDRGNRKGFRCRRLRRAR